MPKPQLTLREYQEKAVSKLLWSSQLEGNDICVLPTGAGKSIVISTLCHKLDSPVLILQPSKEILEQNYNKLLMYVDQSEVGIFSSGSNSHTINKFTFATIQSVYKKPELFKDFKFVIIDECHLVNPKNLNGMYASFLKEIGTPKVFGFTATPFRQETTYEWEDGELIGGVGMKMINRMKPFFWNRIVFNISTQELLEMGYLCSLKYINTQNGEDLTLIDYDTLPTNKSGSDYDLESLEIMIEKQNKTERVINICKNLPSQSSAIVFCISVSQAKKLASIVPNSAYVCGKNTSKERETIINAFKNKEIKIVFNVGVLTTGFDFPELDYIILLRPTQSLALYYQMLGRGVRIASGKEFCNVIDFTGTTKKLGSLESIKIEKVDNKWNVTTDTGVWHNKLLYRYKIDTSKRKKLNKEDEKKQQPSTLF